MPSLKVRPLFVVETEHCESEFITILPWCLVMKLMTHYPPSTSFGKNHIPDYPSSLLKRKTNG